MRIEGYDEELFDSPFLLNKNAPRINEIGRL